MCVKNFLKIVHNWCARGALREQGETKQPIRNVPEANRERAFINAAEAEGMKPPMNCGATWIRDSVLLFQWGHLFARKAGVCDRIPVERRHPFR